MEEFLDLVGKLEDCPWAEWKQGTLHFCEALRCEWIVAPAETWSNFAYIAVAAWLLLRNAEKGIRAVEVRFGLYALVVGIFSGLYHASHTYVFETLDLGSMLFLGTEMLVVNLIRLGWLRNASPIPFSALLLFGGVGLLLGLEGPDRLAVFGAFISVAVFFEVILFVRGRRIEGGVSAALRRRYRPYFASLALFIVAYAAWIVDYTRVLCDPDLHWISGHAVWHVLNSACFLTLASFYRGCSPRRP